jgi:serine/threonine protein phosphatase 1
VIRLPFFDGRAGKRESPGATSARPRLRIDIADAPLYVIGDVHGRLDLLLEMEQRISDETESGAAPWIVLVGDVIDRGPQSAQVLDHIIARQRDNERYVHLCGNHEVIMLAALESAAAAELWLAEGGEETMASYGWNRQQSLPSPGAIGRLLPSDHLTHLAGLPVVFETGDHFVCHAGIRTGVRLEAQDEDDLIWWRDSIVAGYEAIGKKVVHGHQVVPEVTMLPNRVAVDTGAYATGRLSAVRLIAGQHAHVVAVTAAEARQRLTVGERNGPPHT